jgi:hypothetical protein
MKAQNELRRMMNATSQKRVYVVQNDERADPCRRSEASSRRMFNMFALNAARVYDFDGQALSRLDIRMGGTKLLRYIFTDAVKWSRWSSLHKLGSLSVSIALCFVL